MWRGSVPAFIPPGKHKEQLSGRQVRLSFLVIGELNRLKGKHTQSYKGGKQYLKNFIDLKKNKFPFANVPAPIIMKNSSGRG